MGNVHCCVLPSPDDRPPDRTEIYFPNGENGSFELPHISEREDHSTHKGTLFIQRSLSNPGGNGSVNKSKSRRFMSVNTDPRGYMDDITCTSSGWRATSSNNHPLAPGRLTKKFSSTSTIFIDDSTVSQPNLKATLKCVSLAIYYHIKHRETDIRTLDILDEKLHPLTRDGVPHDYERVDPEHRHIYKFIKTLFHAAQLTAECAIITLVYLERLLTYAEIDIYPGNWKRILLAAILLSSKVWDDQAVWNVDYCQILKDITVEDMNELERSYLELLQFNINVPPSTYAKYYFDLRSLADANNLIFPLEPLSKDRAKKLEAISSICEDRMWEISRSGGKRSVSLDGVNVQRTSLAILS